MIEFIKDDLQHRGAQIVHNTTWYLQHMCIHINVQGATCIRLSN